MDGSDIFWVFSSSFFFWPPPHLFQAGLAGGQQSEAKQHRLGGPYSIHSYSNYSGCVETDENARFGIILYPIGKYSGHILDTHGTLVLHSKYIRSTFYIPIECTL